MAHHVTRHHYTNPPITHQSTGSGVEGISVCQSCREFFCELWSVLCGRRSLFNRKATLIDVTATNRTLNISGNLRCQSKKYGFFAQNQHVRSPITTRFIKHFLINHTLKKQQHRVDDIAVLYCTFNIECFEFIRLLNEIARDNPGTQTAANAKTVAQSLAGIIRNQTRALRPQSNRLAQLLLDAQTDPSIFNVALRDIMLGNQTLSEEALYYLGDAQHPQLPAFSDWRRSNPALISPGIIGTGVFIQNQHLTNSPVPDQIIQEIIQDYTLKKPDQRIDEIAMLSCIFNVDGDDMIRQLREIALDHPGTIIAAYAEETANGIETILKQQMTALSPRNSARHQLLLQASSNPDLFHHALADIMGITAHQIPRRFLIYLGSLSTHTHAPNRTTKSRRTPAMPSAEPPLKSAPTTGTSSTRTESSSPATGTSSTSTVSSATPGTGSTTTTTLKKVDRNTFKPATLNPKWSALTADELDQQLQKTPDITCPTCFCSLDDGDQVIRVAQEYRKANDNGLRHQPCFENELGATAKKGEIINPGEFVAGTMTWSIENDDCYSHITDVKEKQNQNGIIKITYEFIGPDTFEKNMLHNNHLNPRKSSGKYKTFDAYLPNSTRGRKILAGFMDAFQQSKDITIATSHTTQVFGVTFGPLHFKTDPVKDADRGYPSDSWYKNAQNELGSLGIYIYDDDNSQETNVRSRRGVLKRKAKRS